MSDVQDKIKQYQWIKGDNFGTIVSVESVDNEFTNFTDGTRIYNSILGEFLHEVVNGVIPLPGADKLTGLVDGKPAKPAQVEIARQTSQVNIGNTIQPVDDVSTIGKMIQKMSKKNLVNIPIQINLNIPSPTLYAILADGMEEEDLNAEIMSIALHQIEFNKLQEYVKDNITLFLHEYYK